MGKPIDASSPPAWLGRILTGRWVGRSREMAEASLVWQQVAAGEGRVLLINGEPGVGKTRFVRELAASAQAEGAAVLTGECYAEGSSPYSPVAQIIGEYFETSSQAGGDSIRAMLDGIFNDLAALIPSLQLRYPDRIPTPIINLQSAQEQIFERFISFCEVISVKTPLFLFIDDVQWADSDTLLLLRSLARRIRKWPILILMTYREAELESAQLLQDLLLEFNRERLSIHLKLVPLNRDETRELLASIFFPSTAGHKTVVSLPADFVDGIYRQTEGNPFFIEEVCKSLIETGQIGLKDGSWVYPDMAEVKIPHSIRAAIQARLRQLPPPAYNVLLMAAVLEDKFNFDILRGALGVEDGYLIQALECAVRAQLLAEIPTGPGEPVRFRFVHALIPATLRESVIQVHRQRYHRLAVQAITALHPEKYEALAYHFAAAGDAEQARGYYRLAGDRACQTAPAEAARYYQAALENWPDEDLAGKAEILARLGTAFWIIDGIPSALKSFAEAYRLFEKLGTRNRSGEMQRMIGRMHWQLADQAGALDHYHQALAILEQGPETPELARAISSISEIHMLTPEDDLAIQWGQRAVAMAERLGAEDVVVHALNNIGSSYAQRGEFIKGISILQESLQRSLAAGLSIDTNRATYNLGVMYQRQCRYSEAREKMADLYTYASKLYLKNLVYIAIIRLVWIDWLTGDWHSALANRALISDFTNGSNTTQNLTFVWMKKSLAMIDLDLGRIEEGRLALEETLPDALRANDAQTTVAHLGQLVRAYGASGSSIKILETARRILELVSGLGLLSVESIMPLFYICQQYPKLPQPDFRAEIKHCLAELERHAQQYQTVEAGAALAEGKATLEAEKDPAAAGEGFRQAAAGWESIGRPYDQARALAGQGQALAVAGEELAARAVWNQALELCDALAAQLDAEDRAAFLASPLVSAIRQGMDTTQASPARQELKSLTRRELEVLKLVAEGLTNAQIAERLVVSPLTINAHLRSIFNKLDVTSRTAAARQALELGLV